MTVRFPILYALLTICMSLAGCERKTKEQVAVANFKQQIEDIGRWLEVQEKAVASDPAARANVTGDLIAKLKAVDTTSLPEDLKSAWTELTGMMGEMSMLMKSTPKVDPSKPEEANKAMEEFMQKAVALQDKMKPVAEKLESLGAKYGFEMSKVAPGK